MAFSKVLSGGLADDAVSGDNIAPSAYLENTTGQNLSGTISQNRMYTSDAYTLTGDLTVNDTVGLMSATGNGTNVTVTADSTTRTITGSGTLEGGELYSSTNSLSGMTGKLASTVTGSPNLNLTSGSIGEGVTGNAGIKNIDRWKQNQVHQTNTTGVVTLTNYWSRSTWGGGRDHGHMTKGTAMTEASGVFTFPSTGRWHIMYHLYGYINSSGHKSGEVRFFRAYIQITNKTSASWMNLGEMGTSAKYMQSSYTDMSAYQTALFLVEDTTTHKVRFQASGFNDNTNIMGDALYDFTHVTFMRLGDL
tara:strand:+ start:81 stop:998 length:918 start_codon:yes stop_codon:yes gene_type:complete